VAELTLELLSEDLPARMQTQAALDLKRLASQRLQAAGLAFDRADAYAAPRRLALFVDGLARRQADRIDERKGPRVGAPEAAIEGFLKAAGLKSLSQCERRSADRGEFWFAVIRHKGGATATVLATILPQVLADLPWPKSMRWADRDLRWVRPLHSILCLFDGRPVPLRFGHLVAGAMTRGHRFLANREFAVGGFADYRAKLLKAKVVLDPEERKRRILEGARKAAASEKLVLIEDEGLLEEVAGLVEWPKPLLGRIEPRFMALPSEVLTTAMRRQQRYFALKTRAGQLAPRFIVVAGTEAKDGGKEIVAGNERVLKARLQDAEFFWAHDRKISLAARVPELARIVFHASLGTLADKVGRVRALIRPIGLHVPGADSQAAERAAVLAKTDLLTDMVGEFPELQGVMGRYYAQHDGESAVIADAIAEHYSPLGPADRCPTAPTSVTLALADKIDTLAGFFKIGEIPTGRSDPFALRRAALGIIRLIVENRLRMPLVPLLQQALAQHRAPAVAEADVVADILDFLADRLKVHLREQGVRHDLIAAVFARGGEDDLVRLLERVRALGAFLESEDGADLLTAYRRAANIVRIEEKRDGHKYAGPPDLELFRQSEERELSAKLNEVEAAAEAARRREAFADACHALARLRRPVDDFFDKVTVNAQEPALRANRLKMLARIRGALDAIADFSQIEG
jgi:glycyl-tRNA synthetase beta chain